MIANTPKPPYYAVIFSNIQTTDLDGYEATADLMVALAEQQPGFLGIESVREGLGITVSYWASEEAILNWKRNMDHQVAQSRGREQWYSAFKVRVAKVERDYGMG